MCIVLMSLALAGCDSVTSIKPESSAFSRCGLGTSAGPVSPGVTPVSPGFIGYDWQVVAISHGGQVTCIPWPQDPLTQVWLGFSRGGHFVASDGVNGHSGTYRTTSDGFTTGYLGQTLVYPYRQDPAGVAANNAVHSFDKRLPATVTLTGDRLVISVGSYTLYCRRCGPRPDPPAGGPITCG